MISSELHIAGTAAPTQRALSSLITRVLRAVVLAVVVLLHGAASAPVAGADTCTTSGAAGSCTYGWESSVLVAAYGVLQ